MNIELQNTSGPDTRGFQNPIKLSTSPHPVNVVADSLPFKVIWNIDKQNFKSPMGSETITLEHTIYHSDQATGSLLWWTVLYYM